MDCDGLCGLDGELGWTVGFVEAQADGNTMDASVSRDELHLLPLEAGLSSGRTDELSQPEAPTEAETDSCPSSLLCCAATGCRETPSDCAEWG